MEYFDLHRDWLCFMDEDLSGFTMVCPSEYIDRFVGTELAFRATGVRFLRAEVPIFKIINIGFYRYAEEAMAKTIGRKLLL